MDTSTSPWTISARSTGTVADRDFSADDFEETATDPEPPPPPDPDPEPEPEPAPESEPELGVATVNSESGCLKNVDTARFAEGF